MIVVTQMRHRQQCCVILWLDIPNTSVLFLLTTTTMSFSSLPVELHMLVLSYINDSFSLHRIERVCLLWNRIVAQREEKGLKFRRKKVSESPAYRIPLLFLPIAYVLHRL